MSTEREAPPKSPSWAEAAWQTQDFPSDLKDTNTQRLEHHDMYRCWARLRLTLILKYVSICFSMACPTPRLLDWDKRLCMLCLSYIIQKPQQDRLLFYIAYFPPLLSVSKKVEFGYLKYNIHEQKGLREPGSIVLLRLKSMSSDISPFLAVALHICMLFEI